MSQTDFSESPWTAPAAEPANIAAQPQKYVNAARLAWRLPVAGMLLCLLALPLTISRESVAGLAVPIVFLLVVVAGLICSCRGLLGHFRNHVPQVLLPSVVGSCLNGFFLLMFYTSLFDPHFHSIQRAQRILAALPQDGTWHVDHRNMLAVQFPQGWHVTETPEDSVCATATTPLTVESRPEEIRLLSKRFPDWSESGRVAAQELRKLSMDKGTAHQSGSDELGNHTWDWVEFDWKEHGESITTRIYLLTRPGRLYAISGTRAKSLTGANTPALVDFVKSFQAP